MNVRFLNQRYATAMFVAIFAVHVVVDCLDANPVDDDDDGRIQVYHADGTRANNCSVVSASPKRRVVVYSSSQDKLEMDGYLRPDENADATSLNKKTLINPDVLKDGKLLIKEDTAYFIVSADGQQAAFVPFNHQGNVTLRQCASLELDANQLTDIGGYHVVVTWKNCLAGDYTTLASSKPGDPEKPELDWRFRTFVSCVVGLEVKTGESLHLTLPPGEVEIAAVSHEQSSRLIEFAQKSNEKNELAGKPNFENFVWPANNGIHRTRSGKTTQVSLVEGTCLTGTLVGNSDKLPDWNDEGFVEAHVSFGDVRYLYSRFIPGYDIVNKGVDHYYSVLNSDVGRHWRTLGGSRPIGFLQTNGTFMTTPVPSGQYYGRLTRPNQRVTIEDGKGEFRDVQASLTIVPKDAKDPYDHPTVRMTLINALQLGTYYGDFAAANEKLFTMESQHPVSRMTTVEKQWLANVKALIERRKELDRIYVSGNIEQSILYNQKAGRFLLDVAAAFLDLEDYFVWTDNVLKLAARFPVELTEGSDKPTLVELEKLLEKKRVDYLKGKVHLGTLHVGSIAVRDKSGPIMDIGEFKYDWPMSRPNLSGENFRPLQRMKLDRNKKSDERQRSNNIDASENYEELEPLKSIKNRNSTEYRELLAQLHKRLEDEFDQKIQEREAQLNQLKAKIESALDDLHTRKANRKKIIQRRLKALQEGRE